jgi:1-acyl-sn-glycerol-3-phosphate acyltransferase
MREQLLKLLAKMPVKVQQFVAHKALNHIFTKIAEVEVEGRENLPSTDETVIFICNHLSNIDGPALNTVLRPYDPTFVAGMKLTNDPFTGLFKKVFKSIDIKPNSPDKAAMKEILSLLKNGKNVVIFPEGTRSRVGSMIEGKRGILLLAKISKVRIIPLAMTGSEKILPIKDKDMTGEKLHHGKILIKVGEGFRLPEKEKNQEKDEYESQAMNLIMGNIAKMLPESYQGFYAQK